MPFQYDGIDLSEQDAPVTITRVCREPAGCGEEMDIEVHPDGSYAYGDPAVFVGTIDLPTDDARAVSSHTKEDEWFGPVEEIDWSETEEHEFWLHWDCVNDGDADVEHTVA